MGFSRQEYQSGLPFPSLEDLPNPGIKPTSPMSPALAGGFFTTEPTRLLLGVKDRNFNSNLAWVQEEFVERALSLTDWQPGHRG